MLATKPEKTIPPGYMQDAKGRLTPVEMVAAIDKLRDDTVERIVARALALQSEMREVKTQTLSDIQAFVELSAERYGVEMGGVKGNVQLMSYDGRYKVLRSIAEYITFDERLQVAKELIDSCIHRWSEGARSEIRALVQDAFQTDKTGKISTSRVLGLRRLDISDKEWQQAMQAISDSIQITGSKTYIRIYRRVGESDQFEPVSLDIAGL